MSHEPHRETAGHGPTLLAGLSKHLDLKLVGRREFGSGAVAMRYEPKIWLYYFGGVTHTCGR